MAINLLNIEPHKVSTDLSGYVTYVYGQPKTGKTTLSAQAPSALLLAFEEGYKAIPGIMAQPITTWSEMKQVLIQLKKPETKERFKTIVVDTVDIAGELCEKYVCQQHGVEEIGKVPFGQGWGKLKKEFESVFRTVVQMGYALFFISHSKTVEETNPWTGATYTKNIPTCPGYLNQKIAAMADIYAFAEKYVNENMESKVRLVLRSPDNSAETGSRFKYIPSVIEMGYEPLVAALNEAINKEAEMNGGKFITNERNVLKAEEKTYEQVIDEFNATIANIMENVPEEQALKGITWEVEKILGKDKKVSDTTPGQKDLVIDIINNLKANMNYKA